MSVVAGWYGKIAGLGDFASRRLSPQFVARWDAWAQRVVAASRARLGGGWLDAYLSCPVWRFVEWPGDPADAAAPLHVGALMPSVDKVGRYFPLCIAAPLPAPPAQAADWQAVSDWLDRVETVALHTLDTRRSAQQFDDALVALPLLAPAPDPAAQRLLDGLRGSGVCLLPQGASPAMLLSGAAGLALARAAAGRTLWWTGSTPSTLIACPGLPDDETFTAMLRADPADHAPCA